MRTRNIAGLLLAAALPVVLSACEERAGGGGGGQVTGQATGQDGTAEPGTAATHGRATSEAQATSEDRGETNPDRAPLPDAPSLGIRGWQKTDTDGAGRAKFAGDGLEQRTGVMRSLASTRPELTAIPDEDGRLHLTGLVEPDDQEAIAGVFASAQLQQTDLSSVPPTSDMRAMGELAAAVMQLLAVEPSAEALANAGGGAGRGGSDADLAAIAPLRRAAEAWTTDTRVWRVVGLPPGADDGPLIRFMLTNAPKERAPGDEPEPEDNHDEQRHQRLRDMGILGFEPIEGGSLGDLVTAWIEIPYQNKDRVDRIMTFRFVYDSGTDRWVLFLIHTRVNTAELMRLHKAGKRDEYRRTSHELDLLRLLPNCHLVVGEGGPVLRKEGTQ
ncbi:MAG: hypothetical protein ACIAS6_10215 [Phycisphaerales bacterium JB060]